MYRKILLSLASVIFLFLTFKEGIAQELSTEQEDGADFLVYIIQPITNVKILPDSEFIPGSLLNEISISASPGEYEPASFAIYALSDIEKFVPKPGELKGENKNIPSQNIDIRIVKCWYQAGKEVYNPIISKVYTPELLLKDDSLIKVDTTDKKNYIKLNLLEGETYVDISDEERHSDFYSLLIKDFPVKDSQILLPVDIPKDTNRQFWVTVKVPEDAVPGEYTGNIQLETSKGIAGNIELKLKVLPINLSKPYTTSSIYYRGILDHGDEGSISSELKSREQFRKEMENMVAHGVTNPTLYQNVGDKELLGEALQIRQAAGMDMSGLYFLGMGTGNSTNEAELNALKIRVTEVIDFCKGYGIPEVYFYGLDEATGETLKSQRLAWQAVQEVGGKTFVAGGAQNFYYMGSLMNVLVWAYWPSRREAEIYHSVGNRIFSYANPQVGNEEPETYRRNYGLLIWKFDYDGQMDYAYQHSFGFIWNDFDHIYYRDHVFAYPTMDGVIDTIQWEGYREGIDDLRYLTTLLQLIERAKESGDNATKDKAIAIEEWLDNLYIKGDLDNIRKEIINRIIEMQRGIISRVDYHEKNKIYQNYPNPFNLTTTINFSIEQAGNVSVEVYNVAGQKVDTIVDEFMESGSYSVVWNVSDFAAGVYFCTVKSGGFSRIIKMTLLK